MMHSLFLQEHNFPSFLSIIKLLKNQRHVQLFIYIIVLTF